MRAVSLVIALAVAVALASALDPLGAKPKRSRTAKLESAVSSAPTDPAAWLALGRALDRRGDRAPALLCYGRYLLLDPDSAEAAPIAERMWDGLIPGPGESSGTITMRPPAKGSDPWWGIELMLETTRSLRHSGKAAKMSDDQFFAASLESLTLFSENLTKDKSVDAFWRRVAIPYYVQARERGYVESMAYTMMRSLGRPATRRWLGEHADTVAAFQSWSHAWKPGA